MRVDLKARPHKVSTWAVTVTDRIYDVVFLRDSCSVNRCKTRSKATYCGNLTFYVSVVISQSLLACYIQSVVGWLARHADAFWGSQFLSLPQYCRISSTHDSIRHG